MSSSSFTALSERRRRWLRSRDIAAMQLAERIQYVA
jgi:hypothetical protein